MPPFLQDRNKCSQFARNLIFAAVRGHHLQAVAQGYLAGEDCLDLCQDGGLAYDVGGCLVADICAVS